MWTGEIQIGSGNKLGAVKTARLGILLQQISRDYNNKI